MSILQANTRCRAVCLNRIGMYDGQFDMFAESGDAWKTARNVDDIKPYPKRDAKLMQALHGDSTVERTQARAELFGALPVMRKADGTQQG